MAGQQLLPRDLVNICFRLVPRQCVSVPEPNRCLVFLGIVLFQPEQLIDCACRHLHDFPHLGLRDPREFSLPNACGASVPARTSSMVPLRNPNATRLLASASNFGSSFIFRLRGGVSQPPNHTP